MVASTPSAARLVRAARGGLFALLALAGATLQAADVSRQQADAFARKLTVISQQGAAAPRAGSALRRTPVTETELNSWFAYRAQPLLPVGLSAPKLTIVGNGKVAGDATVDLEAIGKRRATGSVLDPWSLLGGRVPLSVAGVLHTRDGVGRFEVQEAAISGVPVPRAMLQELLSYYSRTAGHPAGLRLDDPFTLPANIRQIEVGQGQAVVVQ